MNILQKLIKVKNNYKKKRTKAKKKKEKLESSIRNREKNINKIAYLINPNSLNKRKTFNKTKKCYVNIKNYINIRK